MTKESKPNILVFIVDYAKGFVSDWVKKVSYVIVSGAIVWAYMSITTATSKITSLPKKYDRLLEIRHDDSLKVMQHMKADSIEELSKEAQIRYMKFRIDSLEKYCKARFYRDSSYLQMDFNYFLQHGWVKLNNH